MKSNTNSNRNEFEQFFFCPLFESQFLDAEECHRQVPDPVAECDECEATFVGDWRTVSRTSSQELVIHGEVT
jgi:hypothetical protein